MPTKDIKDDNDIVKAFDRPENIANASNKKIQGVELDMSLLFVVDKLALALAFLWQGTLYDTEIRNHTESGKQDTCLPAAKR